MTDTDDTRPEETPEHPTGAKSMKPTEVVPSGQGKPHLVRRLGIALAVSIGLNLFLLGMFSVRLMHRPLREPLPDDGAALSGPGLLFNAGQALGSPKDPRLTELVSKHRGDFIKHRRSMRRAQRDTYSALRADPFERGKLDESLASLRKETVASQEVLHGALSELAESMTVEQRRKLAELSKLSHRKWRRGGRDGTGRLRAPREGAPSRNEPSPSEARPAEGEQPAPRE